MVARRVAWFVCAAVAFTHAFPWGIVSATHEGDPNWLQGLYDCTYVYRRAHEPTDLRDLSEEELRHCLVPNQSSPLGAPTPGGPKCIRDWKADGEKQMLECVYGGPLPTDSPPDLEEEVEETQALANDAIAGAPSPPTGQNPLGPTSHAGGVPDAAEDSTEETQPPAPSEPSELVPARPTAPGAPSLPPSLPQIPMLVHVRPLEEDAVHGDDAGLPAHEPPPPEHPSAIVPSSAVVAAGWTPPGDLLVGIGLATLLVSLLYALWPALKAGVAVSSYARIQKDELLRNPLRDAILRIVEGRPGIPLPELYARDGLTRSAVRHHLHRLRVHGFVRTAKVQGVWCVFPSASDVKRATQELILRKDACLAEFLAGLPAGRPVRFRHALSALRARFPLSETGLRKVVHRAVRHGFVSQSGTGGNAELCNLIGDTPRNGSPA